MAECLPNTHIALVLISKSKTQNRKEIPLSRDNQQIQTRDSSGVGITDHHTKSINMINMLRDPAGKRVGAVFCTKRKGISRYMRTVRKTMLVKNKQI